MVWMNFAHLFLGLHNSYINLSIFSIIFCHISMTACHMMSKMMIWAIGPMAYVPTKFHWDILKNEGILTTTTTTTTSKIIIIIIIIAKMKPHKNKIPFPFWGNGIIIAKMKPHKNKIPFPFWGNGITRGTVPWGTVNPIPIRLVTGTKDKVSPGNSRWQQLAPFERASVTSYSTLMVTMDLCASVSKLQPSEICLKCAWPPFDLWRSL